jgi:hypothetical protein
MPVLRLPGNANRVSGRPASSGRAGQDGIAAAMSSTTIAHRLKHSLPVLHKRKLDPNDPNPCRGCSDCCEYIAIPISRPRSRSDFDELFWYLLHRNVWIFVDDENDWFVQINTPCLELSEHRCGAYLRRPHICRDYAVDECTTYAPGDPDKYLFKSPADLIGWIKVHRPTTFARLVKHYPGGFPGTTDNSTIGRTEPSSSNSAHSA